MLLCAACIPPSIAARGPGHGHAQRMLTAEDSYFYEHSPFVMRRVHLPMQENQPAAYPRYARFAWRTRNCFP